MIAGIVLTGAGIITLLAVVVIIPWLCAVAWKATEHVR